MQKKLVYKPGPVIPFSMAIIHLDNTSLYASSNLPENCADHALSKTCFPIWSCSQWGLPCHELLPVMRCALTTPFHPYQSIKTGGLLSAALAVSSRFPDVIWHCTLWSPDFPRCNLITARLPDQLQLRIMGFIGVNTRYFSIIGLISKYLHIFPIPQPICVIKNFCGDYIPVMYCFYVSPFKMNIKTKGYQR